LFPESPQKNAAKKSSSYISIAEEKGRKRRILSAEGKEGGGPSGEKQGTSRIDQKTGALCRCRRDPHLLWKKRP